MTPKPTPGPWEAIPDKNNAHNPYWHAVDIHAGPLLVARVQCTNAQRQGPANAAILAAASDMLTALRMVQTERMAQYDGVPAVLPFTQRELDACIDAAITKATGGTP